MSYRNNFLPLAAAAVFIGTAIHPSTSQAAALSGSYGFSRMAAGFPGSTEAMALAGSGSLVFNSDGSCSARFDDTELHLNLSSGSVESSSGSQLRNCNYTASSNGELAVTFTDDDVTYQGSVTADGASLNLAGPDSLTLGKVQMLLAHKSGSGMTAAAVNGSFPVAWTAAGFPSAAESKVTAGTGTITFDGTGTCSANFPASGYMLNRSTGQVVPVSENLNLDYECRYSIATDGAAAVTLSRDEEVATYQGSVSTDGSSFSLAGLSSGPEQRVVLMTGNKAGNGIDYSYVKGSYGIARMALGFRGGTQSSALAGRGAISFDGSGKCSASFINSKYSQARLSGEVSGYSHAENLSCSYSINSLGALKLFFGSSQSTYEGHISADGSSIVLAQLDGDQNSALLLAGERLAVRYPYGDIAGKWTSGGLTTPVKDTADRDLMAERFGYDLDRLEVHADGSGTSERFPFGVVSAVSTKSPLPAGSVAIYDEEATGQSPDNYFFMNAGKDVMLQFRKDSLAGEQQLLVDLKQGDSYSMADLAGTWVSAGIKTPAKYSEAPELFGYDVEKLILSVDGSGTSTTILSSDSSPGASNTLPVGGITIGSDGAVVIPGITASYVNAAKDVMFQLRQDSVYGQQQLFVSVKQGNNYSFQDLVGNWFGAAIKTPLKGSTSANFGYEVLKLVVNSGGTGRATPFSTSNSWSFSSIYNDLRIAADGVVTTLGSTFYLNASKDVLVQFKKTATDQQLFVYLKEATIPVFRLNGSCGSANGAFFAEAPAASLCNSGTPSAVTGTGPWNWICSGANGGTAASCSAGATASTWTLTVTVTGNGSVNSSSSQNGTGGINCASDSASGCTASFLAGEEVQLFASPGAGSLFTSWSGSTNGATTSFPIVMDGDKAITAIFDVVPKVMVGPKGFATLQAAYDDAYTVDGSIIRLLEGFLPGSFTAWRGIGVKLEGGYDESFGSRNSSTTISAPFNIRGSQVKVQGVKVTAQQ